VAVQVETQGQLQEFLGILKRRKWQVILPAAVVLSLGIFVAVVIPKKYVVKTQIELRPVGVSISSKEAANAPFQIKSLSRIKKVTQELQNQDYLGLPPSEQFDWLEDVQQSVKVTPGAAATTQGASFVNIEYSNVNVDWAADFLRALRNDWTEDVIERDRRKIEDEVKKLNDARTRLEKQYQNEEAVLTELLRRNGLSATQPTPGADASRTEDPVFERLRRNEVALDETKVLIDQLTVRKDELVRRLEELPPRIDQEELLVGGGSSNAAELKQIDDDIQALQAQLEGIRPIHSRFKEIQQKIRAKEIQREQMSLRVSKGELQKRTGPNPLIAPTRAKLEDLETELRVAEARRASLEKAVEDDSRQVEQLHPVYREVRERRRNVDLLKENLAAAELAFQSKSRESAILSSPLSNPFEITQEVDVPSKPTEPNPWLIVSFALVAGIAVGLGTALFLEFSRNCFRSVGDIGRVMAVPVLGAVGRIATRREQKMESYRRIAVGALSVAAVGAVLFITWAWANDASSLSQDVRDAIEGFRARFR
jgi:uncharacterized protein involved in exopolysaccharide biosynthesis